MDSGTLSIIIAARNEAATIAGCLGALQDAVARLSPTLAIETLVCLNGTSDDTETRVAAWRLSGDGRLNLRVIHSAEGKINAHREALARREYRGPACFIDADVAVDPDCLVCLRLALGGALAAYATVEPSWGEKPGWLYRLQVFHYAHRDVLSPRHYLHGRAFILHPLALAGYAVPSHAAALGRDPGLVARHAALDLASGPRVDDIFLSRMLAHAFGPYSIAEARGAVVRFTPPGTLADFYRGQRRLWTEIRRLDLLYPEHAPLQPGLFQRRLRRERLCTMPWRERLGVCLYHCLEAGARRAARLALWLAAHGLARAKPLWPNMPSTKIIHAKDGRIEP